MSVDITSAFSNNPSTCLQFCQQNMNAMTSPSPLTNSRSHSPEYSSSHPPSLVDKMVEIMSQLSLSDQQLFYDLLTRFQKN